MGIWDRSIMRGRRILPNVAEPLTEFGTTLNKEFVTKPLGARDLRKVQISPKGELILSATSTPAGVYVLDKNDGALVKTLASGATDGVAYDGAGSLYFIAAQNDAKKYTDEGALLIDKAAANVGRFSNEVVWAGDRWATAYAIEGMGVLDADCNVLWSRNTLDGAFRGLTSLDGDVVVLRPNLLQSYAPNGALNWQLPFDGVTPVNFAWALGTSRDRIVSAWGQADTVYPGSSSAFGLHAHSPDGTVAWEVPEVWKLSSNSYAIATSPCEAFTVDRFGHIYVLLGDRGRDLFRFSPDGELVWSAHDQGLIPPDGRLNGNVFARGMTVDADGNIYVSFSNGDVMKISQS